MHNVDTKPNGWGFNGDYDKPTFTPSILVTGGHYIKGWKGPGCWCTFNVEHPKYPETHFKCVRCHSFVTDGKLIFLDDCSHALAGQTVQLVAPQLET